MSLNLIKNFILLTVLLVQFITNGFAIKCFVCDSSDNPSCADIESNSSIVAEECTLDKMKSLDTWLFELNKISYFDTGANKSPLMNCQKVVARDPHTNKMVTARFCQLNTGESDACQILRSKLNLPQSNSAVDTRMTQNNGNNNNNNGRRMLQQQTEAEQFHCSNCYTDNCNGASSTNSGFVLKAVIVMIMMMMMVPVKQIFTRLW